MDIENLLAFFVTNADFLVLTEWKGGKQWSHWKKYTGIIPKMCTDFC